LPFVAENGEPCPNVDSKGKCHQLPETDSTNNVIEVPIFIPSHPGRQGAGPLAGNNDPIEQSDCHDGPVIR
jgi:hypothetical protein